MSKIVCSIDPFVMTNEIYKYEDGTCSSLGKAPFIELNKYLINICYNEHIYDITLKNYPDIAHKMATLIQENELKYYGKDKIKITIE